jgi:hypothetical protein
MPFAGRQMNLKNSAGPIGRNVIKVSAGIALLLFATERQAQGYTDPGTGAMIWQMLAAGAVGVLFYFRKFITWFKVKKKDEKN